MTEVNTVCQECEMVTVSKKEAVPAPSGERQGVMPPDRQKLWRGWLNSSIREQIGVYDTWICSFAVLISVKIDSGFFS